MEKLEAPTHLNQAAQQVHVAVVWRPSQVESVATRGIVAPEPN
jgi:hypothetical protein